MAVPFIDLRRFEDGFLSRWADISARISAHTQFVGGPEAARLEGALQERCQVKEAIGCANGTDALQLALRAAGVGVGVGVGEGGSAEGRDLVLIPEATFWATFEAVVNCGARVVTVDVDPADLQMDFDLFCRAVDEHRPRAAILVHLYGWGSRRIDDFREFCRRRELPLIEDAAQAYGVRWRGESIFRDALVATLSFYPAKVLGSCGDAGAVLTNDAEIGRRARLLGNHGRTSHYEHGLVGWNSRMGGFDAAFLNLSLEYVDARLESRRQLAERYLERLEDLGIETVAPPEGYVSNGYLNVCLPALEERPLMAAALKEAGVGSGQVYPGAMSTQPGTGHHLAGAAGGEIADDLCRRVLNLPLFAYMREAEQDEV
ncbi:MAG: DegT/DnrJ/EryC1/StrS family aminotransferase, partial [Acidobacteriota bacterium]